MAVDVDHGAGVVLRHDVVVPDLVVESSAGRQGRGRDFGRRRGKALGAGSKEEGRKADAAKSGHDANEKMQESRSLR